MVRLSAYPSSNVIAIARAGKLRVFSAFNRSVQWYDIEPGFYPAHYLVEPAPIRFIRKDGIRFWKNSVEDQDAQFGVPTRTHKLKSRSEGTHHASTAFVCG